jgi:CheY-like chemotaxis protein
LIVEDDLQIAAILIDLVQHLDHAFHHVTTLAEARTALEAGDYCYVLLDMMIPEERGSKPVASAGEVCLELARKRDPRRHALGKHYLPVLVVTSYSREPDFVFRMSDLGADAFIAKPFQRPDSIFEKIQTCLERSGRAHHAACGSLAPPETEASGFLVYSHDRTGEALDTRAVEELLEGRTRFDLFLNHVSPTARGYLANRRDWHGQSEDRQLTASEAAVLAELMIERRPLRATTMRSVRMGGIGDPVRLIERARAAVDLKKRRTEWRAIRTITHVGGDDTTKEYFFDPPRGMTWAVLAPEEGASVKKP